jgi:FkbM family methyltransferase
MLYQRILRKALSSSLLGEFGRAAMRQRIWTVERGLGAGLRLKHPQNSDYITGVSELPVQEQLIRFLKPGQVFYDIGANMGFFSLLAARLIGSSGSVCSFEPLKENADHIRANAALNNFAQIQVYEVAIGSSTGTAELLVTDWDGGSALANSPVKPSKPSSTRTVPVRTLDELIRQAHLRSPDFIKIDVEGVELDVLKGMTGTLKSAKPTLLFEVDDGDKDRFSHRWNELDGFVEDFGYFVKRLPDSYGNVRWNVGHSLAVHANSHQLHD